MISSKRNDILLYALCIAMCAISYVVLTKNIELSLLPHKIVMEYLFNFSFAFVEDVGYEQTNRLFIIARNCLGVKLFINLFLIMVFGCLHKYVEIKHKIAAIIKFYSLSLVSAFTITMIRISASVPFCTWERFHLIHSVISLIAYFASGLVLFYMIERKVADI